MTDITYDELLQLQEERHDYECKMDAAIYKGNYSLARFYHSRIVKMNARIKRLIDKEVSDDKSDI